MKQLIIDTLLTGKLLPLFYEENAETSIGILRTLYKAGVRIVEYTNRGDQALANFKQLKEIQIAEMPDLYLGIGTIKSAKEAADFIALGADFIVSPIVNPAIAGLCDQRNLLWIPGCMTPTEIYTAQQLDAPVIKLFPANILGPAFMSSIRELFRGQLFIPTGGVEITEGNLEEWFSAGVCAVGMGSKLITMEIVSNRNYHELYMLTKKALSMIKNTRLQPLQV
jgi:2-dehydro-3-deoxyphosphogluconate aldolase/(4S)-4-hydroxy-2-oxoglutarate aldolase